MKQRLGFVVRRVGSKRKGWAEAGLLIGWLVLGILAGTQFASAQTTNSGTTTLTFNIVETIEVTKWPDTTIHLGPGVPGQTVMSNVLSISLRSNTSWGLYLSSNSDTGMMQEFNKDDSTYVAGGKTMGPVEWATHIDGPWIPLTSTPAAIFSEQDPTGEDGVDVGFLLRVTPSFNDEPLDNGRDYRIDLTYTAGVGF